MTGNRINRGLAVMPGQEPSSPVNGRPQNGDQSPHGERRHQERMTRKPSAPTYRQAPHQQAPHSADVTSRQWDDSDWDQDVAGRRARRLLSKSNSKYRGEVIWSLRRWLGGEPLGRRGGGR